MIAVNGELVAVESSCVWIPFSAVAVTAHTTRTMRA